VAIARDSTAAAFRRPGNPPVIILRPAFTGEIYKLKDLWAYRELFWLLVWRLVAVRYKETVVGIAWAVIQPFSLMIVFTVFFGLLARVASDGTPYALFVYSGLLMWQFVSQAITQGGMAVVNNAHIVTKVYFPRMLLPAAAVCAAIFDFIVACPALVALLAFYGIWPSWWGLLLFPLALVISAVLALGFALWFSTLNVFYRDVNYILPFLMQLWMFSSPIVYPLSLVPAQWQPLYAINPMVSIVQACRWAFAGGSHISPKLMTISAVIAVAVLVSGFRFFRRREAIFSDII
jgi:lipopolysaccharide transport system permease protein